MSNLVDAIKWQKDLQERGYSSDLERHPKQPIKDALPVREGKILPQTIIWDLTVIAHILFPSSLK